MNSQAATWCYACCRKELPAGAGYRASSDQGGVRSVVEKANLLEPPGISHSEVTVNGVRLHYVHGGRDTIAPLVLLHGFPQSWLMWRLILPALMLRHFIVAADLRGYGDSEKPLSEAGHDQTTKASDIHALVEDLGLERVVLI